MNLHLVDPNDQLVEAWENSFAFLPNVTITCGLFEDVPEYDCLINAGNSFGLMDGGVDGAISRHFPRVSDYVQQHILRAYAGEQPVGTSFITLTADPDHPYIAHTPTMRVPESIRGTDNVYNALRAALLAIENHNRNSKNRYHRGAPLPRDGSRYQIEKVLCMGLGTATGKMPPHIAAHQMALAYSTVIAPITEINWSEAQRRHEAVRAMNDLPSLV